MVTDLVVQKLALSLPDVIEKDHHGFPSYRVAGRIIATVPQPDRLRTMADEHGIRATAANHPDTLRKFYWGKDLACVEVDLTQVDGDIVRELLTEAWDISRARTGKLVRDPSQPAGDENGLVVTNTCIQISQCSSGRSALAAVANHVDNAATMAALRRRGKRPGGTSSSLATGRRRRRHSAAVDESP